MPEAQSIADLQHQSFKRVGTEVVRKVLILDASGNPIVSFGSDPVGIKNASDVRINPATQETLAAVLAALALVPVTGSFYPATQPISAASLPLPSGAATQATLATLLLDATFTGRLGEVQASPTANTVLARLKDLLTGIVLAGPVKPNALKKGTPASYDVDASAVQVFDASADSAVVAVMIANAGDDAISLYWTNAVTSSLFFRRLEPGETWEFPLGYTSDDTNDVWAIRDSAQTNDNVITTPMKEV